VSAALIAEVLSWIFIVAGSVFVLIGGIGLIRLPDFYTRIHAAGITDTMGAWLILIGLMFSVSARAGADTGPWSGDRGRP
jgi:multicomponent Na+:H+ antiporter subunit G